MLYLSLTPLIGAASTFSGGLLLGLTWAVLFALGTITAILVSDKKQPLKGLPVTALVNSVLVFGVDLLLTHLFGPAYLPHQLYIRLLAFNPLIILQPLRDCSQMDNSELLVRTFQNLVFILFLSFLLGFLREFFGAGSLTLWVGTQPVLFPPFTEWAPRLLQGPVGGFFLVSLAALVYHKNFENSRMARPSKPQTAKPIIKREEPSKPRPVEIILEAAPVLIQEPESIREPEPLPETPAVQDAPPSTFNLDSSNVSWGETEESILHSLTKEKDFDKKRVLVIGCGTGEDVYVIAMRIIEYSRAKGRANFRIRGIDMFSARIETAKEGVYRESLLGDIPTDWKTRYLLRNKNEEARLVKMGQEIRNYVEFQSADFLSESIFFQKPADVIYVNQHLDFLPELKQTLLLTNIRQNLSRDGALIMRAEPDRNLMPDGWKKTGNSLFRKVR